MLGKDLGVDISLGMMFYNEQECIENCIQAFLPYMRDFYAVDMGGTDSSREIVSKYTDRIYENSLNDDFSAARNFVLSKCRTKWLFIVDPDEWLSADDKGKFEKLILGLNNVYGKYDAIRIIRYTWHNKEMTEQKKLSGRNDPQFKIIRNVPYIKYINPVHEVLVGYKNCGLVTEFGTQHSAHVKSDDRVLHMKKLYHHFAEMRRKRHK
jgi:glycosyltransferase involved in cell wall biosynthesis